MNIINYTKDLITIELNDKGFKSIESTLNDMYDGEEHFESIEIDLNSEDSFFIYKHKKENIVEKIFEKIKDDKDKGILYVVNKDIAEAAVSLGISNNVVYPRTIDHDLVKLIKP